MSDPVLIARLRFLADVMEGPCKEHVATMPNDEIDSTLKMCQDFRESADQLEAQGELLALVLDEMAAATNRDLAADGAVGDEEGVVWAKIEKAAGELRLRVIGSDAMPAGMTFAWIKDREKEQARDGSE